MNRAILTLGAPRDVIKVLFNPVTGEVIQICAECGATAITKPQGEAVTEVALHHEPDCPFINEWLAQEGRQ